MTDSTSPVQVIVIERKAQRNPLWLACFAIATLFAGGSTFALWTSSASIYGGQVIAGDLDITACNRGEGQLEWWDISPDRRDRDVDLSANYHGLRFDEAPSLRSGDNKGISIKEKSVGKSEFVEYPNAYTNYLAENAESTRLTVYGHAIEDIQSWKMVPGDTVMGVCADSIVTLEGDNLVAELGLVNIKGEPIEFGTQHADWLKTEYAVVADYHIFVDETPIEPFPEKTHPKFDKGVLGYFEAPRAGQQNGTGVEYPWGTSLTAKPGDSGAGSWDDIRTPLAKNDGRASLGQATISVAYVIHFVDDGVDDYEDPPSGKEDSRYLANTKLAEVAGGFLVLRQVRTELPQVSP